MCRAVFGTAFSFKTRSLHSLRSVGMTRSIFVFRDPSVRAALPRAPKDHKGTAWVRRRCGAAAKGGPPLPSASPPPSPQGETRMARRRRGGIPASDRVLFALTWLCTFPQYIVHKLKIFHKISNKLWHKPLTGHRIRCYNRKRTESPAALWRAKRRPRA